MTVSSRRIVGLLADERRRRVVAALVLADGPCSTIDLAHAAGVSPREAVDALDRLDALVEDARSGWVLRDEVFVAAARAEADQPSPSAFGDEPDAVARVLDGAFRDGRLVHLPTKRTKRVIVLDHLAQRFEIGQRYPEAAVNDNLRQVHDDVAMLRRWLVDEQFLDRSDGMYWRCGGTV